MGLVLLLISIVVYAYYTIWVLLTVSEPPRHGSFLLHHRLTLCLCTQPFIDEDHEIQRFFLPYHYAITIPAVLLVLLFSGAATFIGLVMLRSKSPKKKAD